MDVDEYIKAHHRSMSMRDMAHATGVDKSTICRHVAKLKSEGELDTAELDAAHEATATARSKAAAATGENRADALRELRDLLRAELDKSGGASMARVASEYRRTMEELAGLEHEEGVIQSRGRELSPLQLAGIRAEVQDDLEDGAAIQDVVDAVVKALDKGGFIQCNPMTVILSHAKHIEDYD